LHPCCVVELIADTRVAGHERRPTGIYGGGSGAIDSLGVWASGHCRKDSPARLRRHSGGCIGIEEPSCWGE
jgi:hypothetical protein